LTAVYECTSLSGPRRGPSVHAQQPSPKEPPRVLFNERSNKMEPYSSHRGPGPFPSKRGGYQDRMVSPTEPKSASIAFSKSVGGPPDFGSSRSRRFSTTSNSSFVSLGDRDRQRDKDRRDVLPPSPRIPKAEVGLPGRPPSLRGRDRDSEKGKDFDRGRHGAMGPPPIPAHAWRNSSRESVRHRLSISSVNGAPPRRQPTDESSEFQGPSHVGHDPLHSPVLSHASMSTRGMLSPVTPSLPLPGLVHDLEELKKDVMQSAAARAKQRRQQEEEEREAQKERARRKADELEVKMKAEVEEKARNETEAEHMKKDERGNGKDGRTSVRFFLQITSQSLVCLRFLLTGGKLTYQGSFGGWRKRKGRCRLDCKTNASATSAAKFQ
jgi:serine/arginine repetitive matrix protein 2